MITLKITYYLFAYLINLFRFYLICKTSMETLFSPIICCRCFCVLTIIVSNIAGVLRSYSSISLLLLFFPFIIFVISFSGCIFRRPLVMLCFLRSLSLFNTHIIIRTWRSTGLVEVLTFNFISFSSTLYYRTPAMAIFVQILTIMSSSLVISSEHVSVLYNFIFYF